MTRANSLQGKRATMEHHFNDEQAHHPRRPAQRSGSQGQIGQGPDLRFEDCGNVRRIVDQARPAAMHAVARQIYRVDTAPWRQRPKIRTRHGSSSQIAPPHSCKVTARFLSCPTERDKQKPFPLHDGEFCQKNAYIFLTKISVIRNKIEIFTAEYNRSGLLKKQGCIFNVV